MATERVRPPSGAGPDVALTQDDSLTATSPAGLTYPLGRQVPAPGAVIPVAPGVGWARLPLPGSLGHINSWMLDDHNGGVTLVDTGLGLPVCEAAWDALFAGPLAQRTVRRILCTHLHPDHIGLAGWLARRTGAAIWMTRGEMMTARAIIAEASDTLPGEAVILHRAAGWDDAALDAQRQRGWGLFATVVSPLPAGYVRMQDGDVLDMGAHRWRVVVGSGHSPEHACLWNEADGVLVAGDQVLPRISSNVSVNITEPDADPLGEWLDSIDRLLALLPPDLLVCPAHGEPFRGLHVRLAALRDEHLGRLDRLAQAIADQPARATDLFTHLFNRPIDARNAGLATGEALAHLRWLERRERIVREDRAGVWWFHAF